MAEKATIGNTYLYDLAKSQEENQRIANLQGWGGRDRTMVQQGQNFDTVTRYDNFLGTNEQTNIFPTPVMSATQTAGYSPVRREITRPTITAPGPVDDRPVTEIGGQDLAQTGETAQQRYLAQILSDIENRRGQVSTGYADLYRQAQMQSARRGGLSDVTGYTGGMQQQYRTKVSAAEQANLLGLGTAREAALRDIDTERMAAESNATLLAQQEFEMLSSRQNQFTGTANNYYALAQEALQAGDTERADTLKAQGDQYLNMANEVAGQMQGVFGTAMPQMAPGGAPTETPQTLDIPTIDVKKEMVGTVGVTAKGHEAAQKVAQSISLAANSGIRDYGGIPAAEMQDDAKILSGLSTKLTVDKKGETILVSGALDKELLDAIQRYEAKTGEKVLKWAVQEGLGYAAAGAGAGALSGGAVGGLAGSVLPGAGNIIGAGIGAVSGAVTGGAAGLATFEISKADAARVMADITGKYQTVNDLMS